MERWPQRIRDHAIYCEMETERMEKKLLKTIRIRESTGMNYDFFYTRFNLTKTEQKITQFIMKGMGNKNIADMFFISTGTVKTHIANIRRKCFVKNNVQFVNLFRE